MNSLQFLLRGASKTGETGEARKGLSNLKIVCDFSCTAACQSTRRLALSHIKDLSALVLDHFEIFHEPTNTSDRCAGRSSSVF